jgi:hypothetical protein
MAPGENGDHRSPVWGAPEDDLAPWDEDRLRRQSAPQNRPAPEEEAPRRRRKPPGETLEEVELPSLDAEAARRMAKGDDAAADDAERLVEYEVGGLKAEEKQQEDFAALAAAQGVDEYESYQRRTFGDYFIASLTPFLIFLMLLSFVWFLLEVRYVYTEVNYLNLRWTSFWFIVGIVALNRLIARDGRESSCMYIGGLVVAAFIYVSIQQVFNSDLAGAYLHGPLELLVDLILLVR